MDHVCEVPKSCICPINALEPDEKCPIHGAGEYPNRCIKCGRYMRTSFYYQTDLSHITAEQWEQLLAKARALKLKAISEGWDETED
jgi:hypothetical protein